MNREYVRQIIAGSMSLGCTYGFYHGIAYLAVLERGNSAPGGELMVLPWMAMGLYRIFDWALSQFGADDNKKKFRHSEGHQNLTHNFIVSPSLHHGKFMEADNE